MGKIVMFFMFLLVSEVQSVWVKREREFKSVKNNDLVKVKNNQYSELQIQDKIIKLTEAFEFIPHLSRLVSNKDYMKKLAMNSMNIST